MTTMYTFLMYRDPSSGLGKENFEKLCDIKDYPDLIGVPETLDNTSLSDSERHFEIGLKGSDAWEFNANYDKETFLKLKKLEGKKLDFAVWFGGTKSASANESTPTGYDGKYSTSGFLSVTPSGGGVNEIREMKITITKNADVAVDDSED